MTPMKEYTIWRRQYGVPYTGMIGAFNVIWNKTSHTVKARTDKEAQSRVKRKFAGAGFSSMIALNSQYNGNPREHIPSKLEGRQLRRAAAGRLEKKHLVY